MVSQIKVIKRLFDTSEQIIVATDAGREGELIFRYLYHYGFAPLLSCVCGSALSPTKLSARTAATSKTAANTTTYTSPPKRGANPTGSWASTAHRRYPSPPDTARIRGAGADTNVGYGCERYWENRRFTSEAFWQLHIATDGCDGEVVKFSSSEKWKSKEPAMELYNKVKAAGCATVTKAERKEKTEETPLLYDLTTLQKEANAKLTASRRNRRLKSRRNSTRRS